MANFKNIVGTGFPSYVNDQIKKRVEILNTTNRSNNILQYLTNRNVWFRLSSSVNVNGTSDIAQKNILQGGTLKDPKNIRGGFNETYSKGTTDDLGFKPMPGITNVSIGTGGKWQTLMQADIEFICYDLDQLDTMTKLYMSLGYTLFLEWGHSNYFVEDSFIVNPTNIDFFNSKTTKDSILKTATKKRFDTKGNYECMLGTVYNFEWNANTDGSYNCKIQIMGAGAMAESIKINTASGVNFSSFKSSDDDSINVSSALENILTTLRDFYIEVGNQGNKDVAVRKELRLRNIKTVKFNDSITSFELEGPLTYRKLLNNIYGACNYKGPIFNDSNINGNVNIRKGNAYQLISGLEEEDKVNNINSSLYYGYVSRTIIQNGENPNFSTYITLAHLFTLIQHAGIFSEGSGGITQTPEIYLDYNPENTIIKSSTFSASVDPSKCLINYKIGDTQQRLFFNPLKIDDDNKLKKKNLLINNTEKNSLIRNGEIPIFKNTKDTGLLFNVLINVEFALNVFKNIVSNNESKEVTLAEYLNSILDGINISLGKINSFRPFFDRDSNCIRIIDENRIQQINEVIEIPNFGTKSIVYDYNFNTKISPKLASQIVIAAQARGADLNSFPDDVLSYQNLNLGLTDRLATIKKPSIKSDTERKSISSNNEIEFQSLKKLYSHFYNVYSLENLNPSTIEEILPLWADLQNKWLQPNPLLLEDNDAIPSLIPIEYSIKIDGISGILPYNIFRVPDDRLPKQYRGRVDFAVFSINHEIENNKWYTILRGQIVTRNFK